jgi:hypothetical protein
MPLIIYTFLLLLIIIVVTWISSIKILYHNDQCVYIRKNKASQITRNQALSNTQMIDQRLKLNHFTILGTHNSYHRNSIFYKYEHSNLENQLAYGIRQLELDIHLMPNNDIVYHLQLLDDRTNCYCLSDCLDRILRWSEENPSHYPIFLFFEIKQMFYEDFFTGISGVHCQHLQKMKEQILEVFTIDSFILPEQVRGNQSSISSALKKQRENELRGDYTYENYGRPPVGKIMPVFLDDAHNITKKLYATCETLANFFFIAQSDSNVPYASIISIQNPSKNAYALTLNTNNGQITRVLLGHGGKRLMDNYILARKYGVHIISTDSVQCDNTELCRNVMNDFKRTTSILCNTVIAPHLCNTTVISI